MSDLNDQINNEVQSLCAAADASLPPAIKQKVGRLLMASAFAASWLRAHPALLTGLDASMSPESIRARLAEALKGAKDETAFMQTLRQWRNDEQVRLILRETENAPGLAERLAVISDVADAAIAAAVDFAERTLSRRFGAPAPDPDTGEPQSLVVLGMGKLGAEELNLSSDIDLIFAFPAEGETTGKEKTLSHSEFFTRAGRKVIQYLDQRTADGIAFRVDMRLRPNGQSGPLAISFPAMVTYYREQGRDWERYAMIKARPVTGVDQAEAGLMPELRDFVFRRYADYQVLTSLRDMKRLIAGENRRLHRSGNIKLGRGGIREIEFIVQAVQLIQGGQSPALTEPNIFRVIPAIAGEGLLPADVCDDLLADYTSLRYIEHLLQAQQDRQTQSLPVDAEWQKRLVSITGHTDWADFLAWLDPLRERVSAHFEAFIAPPDTEVDDGSEEQGYWLDPDSQEWHRHFGTSGDSVRRRVSEFLEEAEGMRLSEMARSRLDRLMPVLMLELARLQAPETGAERVFPVLLAVVRRSAYLVMLLENPEAVRELVRLSVLSPWVATQLKEKPYLLDELTDRDQLYRLPDRKSLRDDLHQRLLRLPDDDLEQQMEQLRHFRHSRVLRAAACELTGNLPLMKISDYLTYTAEEVLQQVFWLAWEQMTEKYGIPTRPDGSLCDSDFAVLAYGKLGGLELSYESDLDLVFIHDGDPGGTTRGGREVDNTVFFVRLGQRMIHFLTTQTPSGVLYEADMRLRPSGNSGLLVSALSAFVTYQNKDAWTWEHQALVRARTVAGDSTLRERVEALRAEVLARPRETTELAGEVRRMREKMRANLGTRPGRQGERFHIKQDPGGIIDIEFLVQYLVLRYASEYPELTSRSDNMRLLEALTRSGIIDAADGERLGRAYLAWRGEVHRQALHAGDGLLHGAEVIAEYEETITTVRECWERYLPGEQGG